jgi:hypothetical protein
MQVCREGNRRRVMKSNASQPGANPAAKILVSASLIFLSSPRKLIRPRSHAIFYWDRINPRPYRPRLFALPVSPLSLSSENPTSRQQSGSWSPLPTSSNSAVLDFRVLHRCQYPALAMNKLALRLYTIVGNELTSLDSGIEHSLRERVSSMWEINAK